jgi:hypothetical protein
MKLSHHAGSAGILRGVHDDLLELPPGSTALSLSWLRRSSSSRSGGLGPEDCGPEPQGQTRTTKQGVVTIPQRPEENRASTKASWKLASLAPSKFWLVGNRYGDQGDYQ